MASSVQHTTVRCSNESRARYQGRHACVSESVYPKSLSWPDDLGMGMLAAAVMRWYKFFLQQPCIVKADRRDAAHACRS